MRRSDHAVSGGMASSALARAAGFLGLWLLLAGAHPGDLPAAAVAVVAAAWTSLRLQSQAALAAANDQHQSAVLGFWTARADFERALGDTK